MVAMIMNLFFGCRHRQITRPITPVHKPGTEAEDTYVACLECGERFHYDVNVMRVGEAMPRPRVTYRRDEYESFQSQF
jgi:hypothetical protein